MWGSNLGGLRVFGEEASALQNRRNDCRKPAARGRENLVMTSSMLGGRIGISVLHCIKFQAKFVTCCERQIGIRPILSSVICYWREKFVPTACEIAPAGAVVAARQKIIE